MAVKGNDGKLLLAAWLQLARIAELRLTSSGYVVILDGAELPVSRRHTRDLKDKLVRAAKQHWHR